MGIPKLFRWLTDQYPVISQRLDQGLNEVSVFCFFLLPMVSLGASCRGLCRKNMTRLSAPALVLESSRVASCYISDEQAVTSAMQFAHPLEHGPKCRCVPGLPTRCSCALQHSSAGRC